MVKANPGVLSDTEAWALARSGDLRGAAETARNALSRKDHQPTDEVRTEMHLVGAFCAMRQGHHADALRELNAARAIASLHPSDPVPAARVDAWFAELAYLQGRYSEAEKLIACALAHLAPCDAWGDIAFALRIRIAICLARADYEGVAALAEPAIRAAEASGDDYVVVQVLNILGAAHFDRATSQLREPHARAHLSSLDPRDVAPMEVEARQALGYFERAGAVATRAHFDFAAWYVAGNIERLEILLGNAEGAVRAIRQRLAVMQRKGAKYDEIVTRSNLAWGLRTLGRYQEALHELDVALEMARETGTFNVLLEFLEYDRSIVLEALGDTPGAQASYRRYLHLVGALNRSSASSPEQNPPAKPKRPLEPYFLKRADRFALDHIGESFTVESVAKHCGVSWRTLEKAFRDFRGVTPVAHIRNLRLDHARQVLGSSDTTIAEIASQCGFASATTFALEYRKRFGMAPSHARRSA